MNFTTILWLGVCALGFALSLKSAAVLRSRSAWTLAGWIASAAYFAAAGFDVARATRALAFPGYAAIALLAIFFVMAGIRDEPQAEPWWWPDRTGLTGKERRERSR
jgi:hypothetical protein